MEDIEPPSQQPPSRRYGNLLSSLPFFLVIVLVSFSISLAQGTSDASGTSTVSAWQIALLALLLMISGFLSGSETSFTAVGQWKIRKLHEEGYHVFGLLERDTTRFITTCLIGSNLANIGATALITQLGIGLSQAIDGLSQNAAVGITTAVMTVLVLIFGEITPKALAVHHSEAVARIAIRPVYLLSVLLYPVGLAFTHVTSSVLRLMRLEPRDQVLITENELELMLRSAEESQVIEEEEREMIQAVIELEETMVREIMTPRVDAIAISIETKLKDVHELVKEHNLSRLPVFEGNLDNIRGIVYTRDLLNYLEDPEALANDTVEHIMGPVYYVPETKSILELLRDMRNRKGHMSIVVDEFGGTAGLVTLEDIIEQITGEIYDETDVENEAEIIALEQGRYRILGSTHLDEVAEELKIIFEDVGDYDTLAGFLTHKFGDIPLEGDIREYEGYEFCIEDADERRINSVIVSPRFKSIIEESD